MRCRMRQRRSRAARAEETTAQAPKQTRHVVKPEYSAEEGGPPLSASQKAARAAAQRRAQEVENALAGLAGDVASKAAARTVVDLPGQGGGEAFVNYGTAIFNAYFHAWDAPDDVLDMLLETGVKIVVARDGTVVSAKIVSLSGNRSLDRSVENALRKVTQLPPFPEVIERCATQFLN